MFDYKFGIEFEYILVQNNVGILDFTNIDSSKLLAMIEPGRSSQVHSSLKSGDLGIKKGFWYPEGDERFTNEGIFSDIKIKGIEIRTPTSSSIHDSVKMLQNLEIQLSDLINRHEIYLGIIGFNPITSLYTFTPELNDWEKQMRATYKEYSAAEISNLSYGPDINLSSAKWSEEEAIDIAEKLTYYSPYMVPFSFSSPFFNSKIWRGYSKRTYERTWRRPAARVFLKNRIVNELTWRARTDAEIGRIEFKAYDAIITKELLLGLSALTLGVALSPLKGRTSAASKTMHQKSALRAFQDREIYDGAKLVLTEAKKALSTQGLEKELSYLDILDAMLKDRETPSEQMIKNYREQGTLFWCGGISEKISRFRYPH